MADKVKDAEDLHLESLFQSPPLDDAGFSARVVRRVRQRLWLRRLSLPAAVCIGFPIAIGPASELLHFLTQEAYASITPGTQTLILGSMVVATIAAGVSLTAE